MKAYEVTANLTKEGKIDFPNFCLSSSASQTKTVKVIILVSEDEENTDELRIDSNEDFSAESFNKSWQQAMTDDTVTLSQLQDYNNNSRNYYKF